MEVREDDVDGAAQSSSAETQAPWVTERTSDIRSARARDGAASTSATVVVKAALTRLETLPRRLNVA